MAERSIAEWQNLELAMGQQGIEDIAFNIQKAILQGPDISPDVAAAIRLLWRLTAV